MALGKRDASEHCRLDELCQRLLDGETDVADELASALILRTFNILRAARQDLDREQAVLDAVTECVAHLNRFDRRKSGLVTWVAHAARRNLADQFRHAVVQRRAELAAARSNVSVNLVDVPPASGARVGIKSLLCHATQDRVERAFFVAWLRGRPLRDLAQILSAGSLPSSEQRKIVHRLKERLRLKIKRRVLKERLAVGNIRQAD